MQTLAIIVLTVIIFYITYRSTKLKNIKKLFVFYAIYMGMLGFLLIPNEAYDLYMHYKYLNNTRLYGLQYLQINGKSVGLVTYQYLFYFFSKLPLNNFLGMFTAFITYFCPLMVIYHYSEDNHLNKKEIMAITVLFLCAQNFIALVSNVRLPIAFAVFVYMFYWEHKNPKLRFLAIIVYITLVFLHPSIIMPIALRYIFVINRKWIKRILLAVFLSWYFILPFFLKITSGASGLLGYINVMMYEYTQDFDRNSHNIIPNISYLLMMVTITGIILYVLYYRYYKVKSIKSNYFEYIYLGAAFIMLGSVATSYHLFLRFGYLLIMLSVFPLNTVMKVRFKNRKLFFLTISVVSAMALISNFVLQYRTAEFGFVFLR